MAFPVIHLRGDEQEAFQADVLRGLQCERKYLLPKYLYDQRGSELFELITLLPEYYLTRSEQEILERYSREIISQTKGDCWLVELGAGSGKKTRTLLSAFQTQTLRHAHFSNASAHAEAHYRYIPIDISEEFLYDSSLRLQREFPMIPMQPVCADFLQGVEYAAAERNKTADQTRLIIYFPGSTIGNLTRVEAAEFFLRLRKLLQPDDALLLAADMNANAHKSIQTLHDAYNDASGITAAFNLNILHRMNRELSATIPLDSYKHVAYYNAGESRVELFLESMDYHAFTIGESRIEIAEGERIHTEYSHKFSTAMIHNMADLTDFTVQASWHDAQQYMGLYWLCAY